MDRGNTGGHLTRAIRDYRKTVDGEPVTFKSAADEAGESVADVSDDAAAVMRKTLAGFMVDQKWAKKNVDDTEAATLASIRLVILRDGRGQEKIGMTYSIGVGALAARRHIVRSPAGSVPYREYWFPFSNSSRNTARVMTNEARTRFCLCILPPFPRKTARS